MRVKWGEMNPERIQIIQPRVARRELPWVDIASQLSTLKGLNLPGRGEKIQPFQGWIHLSSLPKVVRERGQPWAE